MEVHTIHSYIFENYINDQFVFRDTLFEIKTEIQLLAGNQKDKYQVFLGGNYPELKIETNNKNNKNLLLIKDSYANSFIPFIIQDYDNICVVDLRYFKGKISEYIQNNNITDILLLYNIQSFAEEKSIEHLINTKDL